MTEVYKFIQNWGKQPPMIWAILTDHQSLSLLQEIDARRKSKAYDMLLVNTRQAVQKQCTYGVTVKKQNLHSVITNLKELKICADSYVQESNKFLFKSEEVATFIKVMYS